MQTFILDRSIYTSALYLDPRRRFKQAVECKQIYLALTGQSKAFKNHPATLQWTEHRMDLLHYGFICMHYSSNDAPKLQKWYAEILNDSFPIINFSEVFHALIPWHRGLLLRKDYNLYQPIFPEATSTGYARYLDPNIRRTSSTSGIFHIKSGKRIYD